MIFWFDAGMNSLPAFREYSVSPVLGSTMRSPICAFANFESSTRESIERRRDSSGDLAGDGGAATPGAQAAARIAAMVSGRFMPHLDTLRSKCDPPRS